MKELWGSRGENREIEDKFYRIFFNKKRLDDVDIEVYVINI